MPFLVPQLAESAWGEQLGLLDYLCMAAHNASQREGPEAAASHSPPACLLHYSFQPPKAAQQASTHRMV